MDNKIDGMKSDPASEREKVEETPEAQRSAEELEREWLVDDIYSWARELTRPRLRPAHRPTTIRDWELLRENSGVTEDAILEAMSAPPPPYSSTSVLAKSQEGELTLRAGEGPKAEKTEDAEPSTALQDPPSLTGEPPSPQAGPKSIFRRFLSAIYNKMATKQRSEEQDAPE